MYSILDLEKVEEFRQKEKLQPFRIKQIYHNIFKNSIIDFDEMTDLPKDLRQKLKENFYIVSLEATDVLEWNETTKINFKNKKWHNFETVLMFHRNRIAGWEQDNRIGIGLQNRNRIAGWEQDNRIQDYNWKYSDITEKIIGIAYKVYNELWSWLQEKIYQKAMKKLLEKEWLLVKTEVKKNIVLDGEVIWYWKIDLLVNDKVVVELKVSASIHSWDYKQIKKYLSSQTPVWLLISFQKDKVKIKRSEYSYKSWNPEKSWNPDLNRITICVSSQIGCAVGCKFCVTWKLWFIDNLEYSEIVEQLLWSNHYIKNKFWKKEDRTLFKIRNVVFMGMWEPFLNYDNVKKAIEYMKGQNYLSLSKRHITISTSGIVPWIKKMLEDNLEVMLAISLHSANAKTREEIMPITERYSLDELVKTLDEYVKQTKNRVFYEYIMIKDLTDTLDQAKYLAKLLKHRSAHVNLISYNENPVVDYKTPPVENIIKFKQYLEKNGVTVTTRDIMWREIKWACGQLGYEKVKKNV